MVIHRVEPTKGLDPMPTWRITYPPRCYPRAMLVEDVDADELIPEATGTRVLVAWRCYVDRPYRIVLRRVPVTAFVESACWPAASP